nr:4Fe-4S dicluster domain-containing protein [Thermodesulforhabdus norvegica]
MHIDEVACVQCGECAVACAQSNPGQKPAMTNVAVDRIVDALEARKVVERPTILQKVLLMSPEERSAFWNEQFSKCIRCYGCVEVCPVYLDPPEELSFDKWIARAHVPPEYPDFHLLRAYHVYETCVLCGECEITCPVGIPLKTLQDLTQYFTPGEVFDLIPGAGEDVRRVILEFVQKVGEERVRRIRHAI